MADKEKNLLYRHVGPYRRLIDALDPSGKRSVEKKAKVEERRPPGHAPRPVDPKDPSLFKWGR